jgi:hypothetical protein
MGSPLHETEEKIHRTFLEFLTVTGHPEVAAAALGGEVSYRYSEDGPCGLYIDLPPAGYDFIARDNELQQIARVAMRNVATGHLGNQVAGVLDEFTIEFRMKLSEVDGDWKNAVRSMILNFKGSNQALVTEMCAAKDGKPVHVYNELRYASKSEIKIAMEPEASKVLFFPLAVGVKAETGIPWKDHREADFLICHEGVWGILEVAWHPPERYEKDAEKSMWFKKAGILCVEYRTAEACYNNPAQVVKDFLNILSKHKR